MGSIIDALAADLKLPAAIEHDIDTSVKQVIGDTHKVIMGAEGLIQDTERTAGKVIDNGMSNLMYTFRDFKSAVLFTIDSAVDNGAQVADRAITNIIDLIQMGVLLGLGTVTVFVILYGDIVFKNGIRIGKLNLV